MAPQALRPGANAQAYEYDLIGERGLCRCDRMLQTERARLPEFTRYSRCHTLTECCPSAARPGIASEIETGWARERITVPLARVLLHLSLEEEIEVMKRSG